MGLRGLFVLATFSATLVIGLSVGPSARAGLVPMAVITQLILPNVIEIEISGQPEPRRGDLWVLSSSEDARDVLGLFELMDAQPAPGRWSAKLLRSARNRIIRVGDPLRPLDLSGQTQDYPGRTDLLVHDRRRAQAALFRPLFLQGTAVGETAQTLEEDEMLISIFGQFSYGVYERWTVGTLVPGLFLSSPNGSVKYRFIDTQDDTVSTALNVTKLRDSHTTGVNLSFYWDSITSPKMVSHTLVTFALGTIEQAEDTVAIKAAGTSSLQTGYEWIREDWNRVLFGPNYNFETRTLGGYLSMQWIWTRFHLQATVFSTNVREPKWDPKSGYGALIEGYWRL